MTVNLDHIRSNEILVFLGSQWIILGLGQIPVALQHECVAAVVTGPMAIASGGFSCLARLIDDLGSCPMTVFY